MEPLTVPLTEPLLQTTQVQQCTMSSLVYNSAVNECRECCVCSQSKLTLTVLINCQETTVKSTYMFEPSGASGFSSMRWLGIFLNLPGWDAKSISGLHPSIKLTSAHLNTWVEQDMVIQSKLPCPRTQRIVPMPRAWTQTTGYGGKCTNHEATMPWLNSMVLEHN